LGTKTNWSKEREKSQEIKTVKKMEEKKEEMH
jgi:hypothetical protein